MKAWNFIKNDCDQEMGKEYSTIVQIMDKMIAEKRMRDAW